MKTNSVVNKNLSTFYFNFFNYTNNKKVDVKMKRKLKIIAYSYSNTKRTSFTFVSKSSFFNKFYNFSS